MLLKRLAFIILSSASNQYQRFLPEIQERLSESIKLLHVPVVQEQVSVLRISLRRSYLYNFLGKRIYGNFFYQNCLFCSRVLRTIWSLRRITSL